jgi:hypothetical protein
MRTSKLAFVVFALLICLAQVAVAATTSIPVKGRINATGSVDLLITIYDREVGGTELYSMTKTLAIDRGVYFGMVDVPESVMTGRQKVFVELARPSAPAIAIAARSQFAQRGDAQAASPNKAVSIQGCSLCFTCGGTFTVFQGAFTTTGTAPQERGSSCSGAVISRTDTRPFLCCQ